MASAAVAAASTALPPRSRTDRAARVAGRDSVATTPFGPLTAGRNREPSRAAAVAATEVRRAVAVAAAMTARAARALLTPRPCSPRDPIANTPASVYRVASLSPAAHPAWPRPRARGRGNKRTHVNEFAALDLAVHADAVDTDLGQKMTPVFVPATSSSVNSHSSSRCSTAEGPPLPMCGRTFSGCV